MNKLSINIAALVLLLLSSYASLAAKPVSVKYNGKATDESGIAYLVYQVRCSNGVIKPISAWDNKKRWCMGEGSTEGCSKKQIKAAKLACKST